MKAYAIAAVAALAAAAPAAAQTPVPLPAFDSVELRGGGRVTLRHGPEQRVTLLRGDLETSRLSVEDDRLTIEACVPTCRDDHLEVEIVTPGIAGVGVHGGGVVLTEGAFPAREQLAAGIRGGGSIDLTGIEADNVAAGIQGGGLIRAHARETLVAGITGGGSIRYLGDPAVTSSVRGGGSVGPAGARRD